MSLKFFNSKYKSSEMIHTAVQLALMILFWGARAYIWGGTLQITSCFLLHFFLFLGGCTKTLLKLMYFEKATIIILLIFLLSLVRSKKVRDFVELFIYSEKTTRIWRNLQTFFWHYVSSKNGLRFRQMFLAFSEYMNFRVLELRRTE